MSDLPDILPCPICSQPPLVLTPFLQVARRTSEKRKIKCCFFVGCRHTDELTLGCEGRIVAEPEILPLVERWNAWANEALAHRIHGWTDERRDALMRGLGWPADRSNHQPAAPVNAFSI